MGVVGTVKEGTKVKLEAENAEVNMPADINQQWIFNRIDNDPTGYFTLTSEKTHMLLHGNSEGDAFVGYEHYSPPLDYENELESKPITSRKSIAQCVKRLPNVIFSLFLGALWHYDNVKNTLSNEKGVKLGDIMPLNIDATKNEEIIQIQKKTAVTSNQEFFGLKNKDDVEKGSFVHFHPKVAENAEDGHQKWKRTYAEKNAPGVRFMLMNEKSNEYLHADWHGYFTNGHIKRNLDEISGCKYLKITRHIYLIVLYL